MGGPSTSTQNSITGQQLQTAQEANQISQQQYSQYQTDIAPLRSYYSSLVSGNPSQAMSAAAPAISNITSGYNASVEQINNSVAPGAARDYALSQIPVQENSQIASTLNQTTQNAYQQLGLLAAGENSSGLQYLGANLSGLSGASSSNQVTMQTQEQSKASTLGVLGSLVGAAGNALGGGTLAKILGY